ncbi:MAG: alpha-tubulin suppressor-like RCC1 family protein/pimeloyl-ACP methyl ester carboxylesterase [Planctomycetota bacterium]|jgi:alpha-tubulin suppressor-like RCC1 family protein/pimeloyl-ACP methyl ester carboxylesterase
MYKQACSALLAVAFLIVATSATAQSPVKQVGAGAEYSALIDQVGAVFTWGANDMGQLGDNSTTDRALPVVVPGLMATSISCGAQHMLALLGNGTVVAWGDNTNGQLGDSSIGGTSSVPVPVQGLSAIVAISAGEDHSLALDSAGQVWAWGANADGQLGDGTTTASPLPVEVLGLDAVVAIAAGVDHSLALLANGTMRAWGANAAGQLGNGNTSQSTSPTPVNGLSGIRSIAAGQSSSLARDADGHVWHWGLASGALASPSPALVPGLSLAIQVIATHSGSRVALTSDGRIWLWEFSDTPPTFITIEAAPVAIGAGGPHMSGHIVSLMGDGNLLAIGANNRGQLGDNTTTTPALGSTVVVSGVGGIPGVFLSTPARQTIRPGETAQFDFIGPPSRFFSIFLDLGPGNSQTPYGIFGLEDSPLMMTFDGIGIFPGGTPTNLQLGPDGRITIFGYPATLADIGVDFYVQAVVYDPTLPLGFLLSQTEQGRGDGAASRLSIAGAPSSAGEARFDRSRPTITTKDISVARGMPSLQFTKPSRTFFVDSSNSTGDTLRIEAVVNPGSMVAFTTTDHQVVFELNTIDGATDGDSQGPVTPALSVVNTTWVAGPGGGGNQSAVVEISPAAVFPAGTQIGVRVRLERLIGGLWTPIDSTRGETPAWLPGTLSSWSNHSFYVTDDRHVVLVHGWGGDEESFGNLEMLLETASDPAKRRPTRGYRGDTVGAGLGGRVSITTQASELNDFLSSPSYGVASAEPDFVCHSMGGLSARRWLADHPPSAAGGVLPSLVNLGVPHYGVPCFLIDLSGDPGERDMRRGSRFLRDLARDWQLTSPMVRVLDLVGLGRLTGGNDGNSDYLVPGYSATMQPNGTSNIIPDAQHSAYYLSNTGHTGSATGAAFLCLAPSGIEYLVPMNSPSHASYRLTRQFIVNRENNPILTDKPSAPNLNRAALWVERPKADDSAINAGGPATGSYTNNDDSTTDCDVYFFNMSNILSRLVGWGLCPGGGACFPAGTTTLLPGGVFVAP